MHARSGWKPGASLYSLILRQTFGIQALIIVLGLALPPLAVIPLLVQERLIDDAVPAADFDLLVLLAAAYAGAVLLNGVIKFAVTWLQGWISEIVARVLRAALIDAQRHRNPAHARKALGTVTSVVTAEAEPLGGFAAEALNTPLIQGGTMVGVVGFMAVTEPMLAAIGIAALAAEAIVTPLVQRRINILTRRRIRSLRRAGADLIGSADHAHPALVAESLNEIRHVYRLRLRMNGLKAGLKLFNNIVGHAADIAVLGFGGAMVIQGETSIGVIVAFLTGLGRLRGPWGEMIAFYRRLADARIKYDLVVSAMNREPRPPIG